MNNFFNLFKKKENITEEKNSTEKQKLVNSLMDVSIIYDPQFIFYNLLVISLERIFSRYKTINNLSWNINVEHNKSNTRKEYDVKINVESDIKLYNQDANIYYDFRDEERELSFQLYLWSSNEKSKRSELLIDSLYINRCEKRIISNIKDILKNYTLTRDNKYEIYKTWLTRYINKNYSSKKQKYIPLIDKFIENNCKKDINIPDVVLDNWIYKDVETPFLTASCNLIIQKRNDYLLYKKNNTTEKRKEVLTCLIDFLVNIKNKDDNAKNIKYDVILECDNDEISRYILKKDKEILFYTEYFKYHGVQSYYDRKWRINSNNLVNDFVESFGSDYKDYSKIKKINEEKDNLEAMLKSDIKKENVKKRRI